MARTLKISFFVGLPLLVLLLLAAKPHDRYFLIAKNIDIFTTLFKEVNTYYVDEVSPNQLMTHGITEMLRNLDPYTNYIPEDRIEDYRTMTTGEYAGVGATVGMRGGKMCVVMPHEGYPAAEAGLKIGDEILQIGDVKVDPEKDPEASNLLRGQAGTTIKVVVKRYGEAAPRTFEIEREKIQLKNVPYFGLVNENTGLIQLTDFTRNASGEVKAALLALKKQGATRIILDLRGNPGGLLTEAINISNVFVPKGSEIVATKGKVEEWNKTYHALDPAVDDEIPLVVLVNGRSASASEIVSGTMQDYDRGVIVGRNSYGKGLVQATRSLSYNSKLKVTVAKYYTASGRCIQAIDYAQRDENGSVMKIPDSLRHEFKTKNGRPVLDGSGVKPDVEVESIELAEVTEALLRQGLIFEYATKYWYEHQADSVEAATFALSEGQYQDFVSWVKKRNFAYESTLEEKLYSLRELAKEIEKLPALQQEISTLEKAIQTAKANDLDVYKNQVRELLEGEILTRYHLEAGEMEATFDDDPDIAEALRVLDDTAKYNKLLGK